MAENKQYITQTLENGKVMISEDVLVSIVSHAVNETEGVVGISSKAGADLGKKNLAKGMKISIDQDNGVSIDCNIIIAYGQSVVAVAQSVQDAITSSVESMTGVQVVSVNVNVCGIARQ